VKIAFVIGRFPALSETFILNQITGLLDRGHQIDIYAEPPNDEIAHDEVDRYNLSKRITYSPRMPQSRFLRLVKALVLILVAGWKDPKKTIRALDVKRYGREASSMRLLYAVMPFLGTCRIYDVVHCHFGPYGVRGMFLRDVGALCGKLVTTFHGADLTKDVQADRVSLYKRLFETGDLFLPISEAWRQRLIELGCPADKISVHHMGINCMEFAFRPRRLEGSEPTRLLSVCRLVQKKGIEYSIRAVAAVAKTGRKVRYDIVGDGPLRSRLDALIGDLGMNETVIIHGSRKKREVVAILDRAHILLAPSVTADDGDKEGIPVALMEAMATGLPVISTRHSGVPELVHDGISGYLVPERDIDALATSIGELVDGHELWVRMGEAGREMVDRHFNIDVLNDQLVAKFVAVVNNGSGLSAVCARGAS
jgi:colanic acid/amylovoran biosynthesis glycosyltransferase